MTENELKNIVLGTYYADKLILLDSNQKSGFYETANDLQEDLEFLHLLVKRNRKSPFCFDVIPHKSCMDYHFWHDLFKKSYCGHTEDAYVRKMLCDYYIAHNFFESIQGETVNSEEKWTFEVMQLTYEYFKNMHSIDLKDYVGSFINCSHTCEEVIKAINEL